MAVKKLQPTRGPTMNKMKNTGIKQKKTLVIAQEIRFARMLASNNKNARAKMLKKLRSWITVRAKSTFAFTETDFLRLWKGLFYCMWMSDKPLVQEELAEAISRLVHCFKSMDTALLYTKCTLTTLSTEWFGIDHYRVDKFEMLVRRIVRQTFVMCKNVSWDAEWTKGVGEIIEALLLDPKGTLGFKFHLTELYMEELAKISEGKIPEDLVTELLRPFAIHLAAMTDDRQIRHVMKHIFRYLIFQSDVGMDYMEKFEAWRKAGFPTGSIDAMQKVELSDEENDAEEPENSAEESRKNKPLDPRAGRVNVDLPQVPFNPQQIANLIQQYKFLPSSTTKTRRQIVRLIREFTHLAEGKMPLGVKEVRLSNPKTAETNSKVAALRLIEFEDELYADTKRRLKRKKMKKNVIQENEDNAAADDDDVFLQESTAKKQKRDVQFEQADSTTENEKLFSKKKVIEKKRKKTKNISIESEDLAPNSLIKKKSIEGKSKLKIKSLQKDLKSKSKKTKTKKLRSIKENINAELLDGIDDFAEFKKVSMPEKKKKKINYDLNNGWDVSSSECLSTPTILSPSTPSTTPVVTPAVQKSATKKNKSCERTPISKIPWLFPVMTKLEDEQVKLRTPVKNPISRNAGSSSKKRVQIVLQKNTAQHTSEYFRQLRLSPAIPFDANRKPPAGVLKQSPLPSPINPFYKKL